MLLSIKYASWNPPQTDWSDYIWTVNCDHLSSITLSFMHWFYAIRCVRSYILPAFTLYGLWAILWSCCFWKWLYDDWPGTLVTVDGWYPNAWFDDWVQPDTGAVANPAQKLNVFAECRSLRQATRNLGYKAIISILQDSQVSSLLGADMTVSWHKVV